MTNPRPTNEPGKHPKRRKGEQPPIPQKPSANTIDPPMDMDQLFPALLDINIRQARAEGQPDLAQALQSLQLLMKAKNEKTPQVPDESPKTG